MRSVVLSNSVLMVTAPPYSLNETSEDGVVIRDQVNEILELAPAVPKLHELGNLLRGLEYDEGQEDDDFDGGGDQFVSFWLPILFRSLADLDISKRRKVTYLDARSEIQASDAELDRGLREKHILNINGKFEDLASSPHPN